ncbi:MAG: 7-cyano-7-deazaguanine synthase [Balneola sp.]|nr:7-cyano-7-deazaguanine synthase [Balneola sp.]
MKGNNKLLLLSGGLESFALAYMIRPLNALTIDYGQHSSIGEIKASKKICQILGIRHHVFNCNLNDLGFGELFGNNTSKLSDIKDWTPFRNQFLITIGCIYATKLNLNKVIIGSVIDDDKYKDGSKEFISLIKKVVGFQEGNIEVCAPAISEHSVDLIKKSKIPFDTLLWSFSCNRSRYACGTCRSCLKRSTIIEQLRSEHYDGS